MSEPDPRRALPAVDVLAANAPGGVAPLIARRAARRVLAEARAAAAGTADPLDVDALEARLAEVLAEATPVRRVLNATGVLLHTNLGRAPLAVPTDPSWADLGDLEVDLATGRRGPRLRSLEEALAALTGAEDAMVVNNGAGALTLVLAALAGGGEGGEAGEVVVSRGQLVEIGGSFRVPEVVTSGGARLREVGTTNRTHGRDYERAIGAATRVLLEVHPSNYVVHGFVATVPTQSLATIGRQHGIPVVVDLGSGLLDERCPWLPDGPPPWLRGEPGARQTLQAGADLVTFSGDKLLGGPQAGLICGRSALVHAARRHPLARALRFDRVRARLLQDTLDAYLEGTAAAAVPFWRAALTPAEQVRERAEALITRLGPNHAGRLTDAPGVAGAGSVPGREVPGWAVAFAGGDPGVLAAGLRREGVLAQVGGGEVLVHLRTVAPADDDDLALAVGRALAASP